MTPKRKIGGTGAPSMALIALAAAIGIPGFAHAQAAPGSVEIGGGGGRFYGGSFAKGSNREFAHRVEVDDDIAAGFWVGAQLSPKWSLEVAVRRTSADIIVPQSGVFPTEPAVATIDFAT